jgi:fructokinase
MLSTGRDLRADQPGRVPRARLRLMQKTILAFGEILWDLLPTGPALGGAPFNFAFRVNTLGDHGTIASRVGRDDLGRRAHDQVAALGMDTGYLQWDDQHPTGTVRITLDASGSPDFFIVPEVAYDFIEITERLRQAVAAADAFCFGTLVQRTSPARSALRGLLEDADQSLKFLDINLRKDCYTREILLASLERADVLKMNLAEARYLAEVFEITRTSLAESCAELVERCGLECCVVTLGEHGVFALQPAGQPVYLPGYAVAVVDTIGSGDALSAGFVHAYLRQQPLAECCALGNALGTLVATRHGATAPITRAELDAFRQGRHERVVEPALKPYAAL